MSRLFRFLSNPDTKALHSKCRKIVILILETFSVNSHCDFLNLTFELILALEGISYFFFSIIDNKSYLFY
jgi:hypothetical protein